MSKDFDPKSVELSKYEKEYTKDGLWEKIGSVAKNVGATLITKVLTLYYALVSDKASNIDKAMIIGALGYFISPVDAIPDFIPGIGYSDDLAVLVFILAKLHCVDDCIKSQAKSKLAEWFD